MPRESAELRKLIEPAVTALGFELVGVEYTTGKSGILRVYIDSEWGISADDCAAVSHQLSGLLDVEDPIPGRYALEISSPGLDRPLFHARDFDRYAGETVRLHLVSPLNGRRKFKGVLMGMKDNHVVLKLDDAELTVTLDEIDQARLVPDYKSHRSEDAQ
jgi:ribosome maturation factor RimP